MVVDTGFSVESDPDAEVGGRPGRNQLTLGALEVADEVLVVGARRPGRASRAWRAALVDLRDVVGADPVRVVINRMRPTLGWSEKEIAGMVAGFARLSGLHFLPDDRAGVDRALVSGRTLVESGESALTRAVAALVDVLGARQLREQQEQPAARESDHGGQQRQLAGELVAGRQQSDGAVVGDHRRHDVADDDRAHLEVGEQRRVVGEPDDVAPVAGAEEVRNRC